MLIWMNNKLQNKQETFKKNLYKFKKVLKIAQLILMIQSRTLDWKQNHSPQDIICSLLGPKPNWKR